MIIYLMVIGQNINRRKRKINILKRNKGDWKNNMKKEKEKLILIIIKYFFIN